MSTRPELLSIVVPIYNEARTIREVLGRLVAIDLPVRFDIEHRARYRAGEAIHTEYVR